MRRHKALFYILLIAMLVSCGKKETLEQLKVIPQENQLLETQESQLLFQVAKEDNEFVAVYSADNGVSWEESNITSQLIPEEIREAHVIDAGEVFVSFIDEENGYLLWCSTPGAGLMTKLLFRTESGMDGFEFVSDLTNLIPSSYPSGIAFSDKDKGVISVTYHGGEEYLYATSDGGKAWNSLDIFPEDDVLNYVESMMPVFYGEDLQNGIVVLRNVGEETEYVLYETKDGGVNWNQKGVIDLPSIDRYQIVNDTDIWFVDSVGETYVLENEK